MIGQIKNAVPWYVKVAAKLTLSRVPLPHQLWKRLGIFEHGPMDQIDYALRVFKNHLAVASPPKGFVCMELGPGDSLLSALVAAAHGSGRTYLVDVGRFASADLALYRRAAQELAARGHEVPTEFGSVPEMLSLCRAEYLPTGLAGLRTIPAASVDFIWSQSVLEHVRRDLFVPVVGEWRRVLKPDGVASHHVDLKDHLAFALNSLRFSDKTWESRWFRESGFYTNRIRLGEMVRIFESTGFTCKVSDRKYWDRLPTPRGKLAPRFQAMSDEELLVSGFTAVLQLHANKGAQ